MYEPYLCDSCYRGKEEEEQFHCNTCKFGPSKAKKFICDKCEANPNHVVAELLYKDSQFEYYKVTVAEGTRMIAGKVTETCEAAGMEAVCAGGPGRDGCSPILLGFPYKKDNKCTITPLETSCIIPM